ncbi:glycosyltransferase family 4 protein [Flavobacterium sp.]|uniref:glycosyltransferase family 4 protein n=1 Tax=Flavobacterium sp. TaxID=239 RepID=UPI002620C58C|nr:glycosyltransferase family 4 protein [Flavobacterium sp.]
MSNKTILATCYAVNPYKGSEDGMGWNFINQIARFNKVIAITRENNQQAIEKFMAENPNEKYKNITFLYFDLPYWMRFWKKGSRGAMLYYYMWQLGIVSFIKKQNLHFDITHNVNFHNDWTPSFLYKLEKQMVWGPIGHHPIIPKHYLKPYSINYLIKDRATWLVKKIFWNLSFSLKKTVKNANHILCMNTGVSSVLNLKNKSLSIQPSVATEDFFEGEITKKDGFKIISVGRFVPLKGFDLTLNSFIKFINSIRISERENCHLTLVGTGPEKEFYKKIIAENKAEKYVEIIEWIDRNELMKLYKNAAVFLFPSHEGAGMVVAEALSFGLPVICLNNEGPGEFVTTNCGFAVPQLDYNNTISELNKALQKLYFDRELLYKMSLEARKQFEENFTWNSRGEHLKNIYKKL